MSINLFTSFAGEDIEQLDSFRALAKNPQHRLKFRDRSQLEPVLDKRGKPVRQPPRWPTSKPIREQIHKLLDESTRLVVLVGESTHESEWVDWEIRESINLGKGVVAMYQGERPPRNLPGAIKEFGIRLVPWNQSELTTAINQAAEERM